MTAARKPPPDGGKAPPKNPQKFHHYSPSHPARRLRIASSARSTNVIVEVSVPLVDDPCPIDGPERIRLLVADDERLFRDALCVLLESEPSFEVVGYAADGAETIRLAKQLQPDVLLLDLVMPHMGGLDTLRGLSAGRVSTRTILLTGAIERPDVLVALQLGARGVVMKDVSPDLLFKSIRVVMSGEYWVGGSAVPDLISAFRQAAPARAAEQPKFGLTPRELEIVVAVAAGRSNREIARDLHISHETVKHHLARIYDKVGASTRVELAVFALHHDLL